MNWTYFRWFLIAFTVSWILQSIGLAQCQNGRCPRPARVTQYDVPILAPIRLTQASGPQTIVQHPPVQVNVEPAPSIHVKAPEIQVNYLGSAPSRVAAPPLLSPAPAAVVPAEPVSPPPPPLVTPSPQRTSYRLYKVRPLRQFLGIYW